MSPYWPKIFNGIPVSDFDSEDLLAQQLVGWGNIVMGYEPPCDLYDVMEAASKITGAFTGAECKSAADLTLEKRRIKAKYTPPSKEFLTHLNDGYIVETDNVEY